MQDVRAEQHRLEAAGMALVAALDAEAEAGSLQPRVLNEKLASFAAEVLRDFWALPDLVVQKYADGWLDDGKALGYPDWWLKAVGYADGPPPPPRPLALDASAGSRLETCVRSCPSGHDFT